MSAKIYLLDFKKKGKDPSILHWKATDNCSHNIKRLIDALEECGFTVGGLIENHDCYEYEIEIQIDSDIPECIKEAKKHSVLKEYKFYEEFLRKDIITINDYARIGVF